jgi:hypothetical protein
MYSPFSRGERDLDALAKGGIGGDIEKLVEKLLGAV